MMRGFLIGGFWGVVLAAMLAVVMSLSAPRPQPLPEPGAPGIAMPEPVPRDLEREVAPEAQPEVDEDANLADAPPADPQSSASPAPQAPQQATPQSVRTAPVEPMIAAPVLRAPPEEASAIAPLPSAIRARPARLAQPNPLAVPDIAFDARPELPRDPIPGTALRPRQVTAPAPEVFQAVRTALPLPSELSSEGLDPLAPLGLSRPPGAGAAPEGLPVPPLSSWPRLETAVPPPPPRPSPALAQAMPEFRAPTQPAPLTPGALAPWATSALAPERSAPAFDRAGVAPDPPRAPTPVRPPDLPQQSVAQAANAVAEPVAQAPRLLGRVESAPVQTTEPRLAPPPDFASAPAQVETATPPVPEPPAEATAPEDTPAMPDQNAPAPQVPARVASLPRIGAPAMPEAQTDRAGSGTGLGRDTGVARPSRLALPRVGPGGQRSDAFGQEAAAAPPAVPGPEDAEPALDRFSVPFTPVGDRPLLAVILRDQGAAPLDLSGVALPLSLAIDPSLADAAARAEAYRMAGREVAIYAGALAPGEVPQAIQAVPGALGVLESAAPPAARTRSIRAEIEARGQALIVPARGLNAGVRAAREAGLAALSLDARADRLSELRRALERAVISAERTGFAVIEAPADPAVLVALQAWSASARGQQVEFAPLSAVVREAMGAP